MMVSVVVVIGALINVSVNGNFINTMQSPAKVGIIQRDNFIMVTNIQFGPVKTDDAILIFKDSSGQIVELSYEWPENEYLKGGDLYKIIDAVTNMKYSVSMAYKGSIVGKTSFTITE